MSHAPPRPRRRWLGAGVVLALAALVLAGAAYFRPWLRLSDVPPSFATAHDEDHDHHDHDHHDHDHHDHDDHDHDDHDHEEGSLVQVSPEGLRNIGYQPVEVARRDFQRTITLPAVVVERPGQTQVHVTAPFTGVITAIHALEGQAVAAGEAMFELRLTHEDLVATQREFLQLVESFDIVERELARLQSLGEGVIAGKRIIEQQYEFQKLQGALRASEQALLLHGLSPQQTADIRQSRRLLQTLTVLAPVMGECGAQCAADRLYHLQRLEVTLGQYVAAGQELGILADHCELYVEGRAFEDDAQQLRTAARDGLRVTARLLGESADAPPVEGLQLLYLADRVDPDSRAFRFYLPLPNQVVLDQQSSDGRRFIEWRFKPGQRLELHAPVERWENQLVLPAEAIVEEGAERFVYRRHGAAFERVPVHVEYNDGRAAVVGQVCELSPGDVVAGKGAFQMHLQMKNADGGAVDTHAGHSH